MARSLLTPKEYEEQGRVLYHLEQGSWRDKRDKFKALPIKFACGSYLMISSSRKGYITEVRAFPPYCIEKIRKTGKAKLWSFHEFPRGKNTITKVEKSILDTFWFFRDPDKKAYEQAALFVRRFEGRVGRLREEESILRGNIQRMRSLNNKFWDYLQDIEKMSCAQWLNYLKRLEEKDPEKYHDFMRKTMTPKERAHLEKMTNDGELLRRVVEGAPQKEIEFRMLFDLFHYLFGFRILHYTTSYPDYILLRDGKEIRAEAELYASRFIQHRHNPNDCDMIVCWRNDVWPPDINLDIFELATGRLHKRDGVIEEILVRP